MERTFCDNCGTELPDGERLLLGKDPETGIERALDYNLLESDDEGDFDEDDELDVHYCSVCLEKLVREYNRVHNKLPETPPETPDGLASEEAESA